MLKFLSYFNKPLDPFRIDKKYKALQTSPSWLKQASKGNNLSQNVLLAAFQDV